MNETANTYAQPATPAGIDPDIAAWIDARAADPTAADVSIDGIRRQSRVANALAAAVAVIPPVESVQYLRVPVGGGAIAARLYRPFGPPPRSDGHPIVVLAHGGGWIAGDLETNRQVALRLCSGAGVIVVDVDYRLAPEHPFPTAFDDVLAAVRWAATSGSVAGGDGSRLAIAGQSAGGQIAASVAIACRDSGIGLAGQLLIAPVIDARGGYRTAAEYPSRERFATGYGLTLEGMQTFASHYGIGDPPVDSDWRASPIGASDLTGVAPAVVHVAGFDLLGDEGRAYAEALRAAGVPVVLRGFPTLNHGYVGLSGVSTAADAAVTAAGADLRGLLE